MFHLGAVAKHPLEARIGLPLEIRAGMARLPQDAKSQLNRAT